jgi:hypothetical protein
MPREEIMTKETNLPAGDLAELNEAFLDLVGRGTDAGLPPRVLEELRAIGPDTRQRLAALPFALFGFGFEDEAAWARLLSPGVRDLDPGYVSGEPAAERFTLLVLTVVRGMARDAPESVSSWIGLPAGTRTRLDKLEIGALGIVAALAAPRLRGRLPGREPLWLGLIDAAARDDARYLRLLATQGQQWTIRRCLGLENPMAPSRGFRR